MKKLIILVLIFAMMLTACSKWNVEIRNPEEQTDAPSPDIAEEQNMVSREILKFDLDILNYLHLVSLYDNGVSFHPDNNRVYYSKTGETSSLPITTTEKDSYCFDHKGDSTFIIVGKGTKKEPFRFVFSIDNGKNWSVNTIDGFSDKISKMYISIVGENNAFWIFNTVDNEEEYRIYYINTNGKITERKDSSIISLNNILYISFVSEKIGYAIGESKPQPALFRTEDGGINWEKITLDIPDNKNIYFCLPQIPCFYKNIGFMRTPAYYVDDSGNQKVTTYFYISTDNGHTWELLFENSDEFNYTEQEAWEMISIFENNDM